MDVRRAGPAFGLILVVSLISAAALTLLMGALLDYWLLSYIIPLSIWAWSATLFTASFSVKFDVAEIRVPVDRAPFAVARWLRRTGGRVETGGEFLIVRADSLSSVKLTFRPSRAGTLVRAQAWASPTGWSATMIPILIWYFSIVAVISTIYIFRKSMRYSVDSLLPVMTSIETDAQTSREIDIRSALLEGLSEARRLASEAYEGTRSNHQDAILLVAIGGIAVFMLSIAGALAGYVDIHRESTGLAWAIAVSIGATVAFVVAALWFVRRRYASILRRLKDWTRDLDGAFQMELSGTRPVDSQRSTIETLADAWKELPSWLSARKKSSAYREPGTWLVIFLLLNACWSPLMLGAMMLLEGSVVGVLPIAMGAVLIGFAVYVYVRWKRSVGSEDSRTKREWRDRSELLDQVLGRQLMGP